MQPFFLPVQDGQRFCLFHSAIGPESKGAVLYIHPFAEEMNKARRMAALQSRALAAAGYDVLQMDLLGCGDSSGDFCDATWLLWQEDILDAWRWLRERSAKPLIFWGLRAGCLLAAKVSAKLTEAVDFIFWQPVLSGKQHWQQFMRMKMAGGLVSGQSKVEAASLRQDLEEGLSVEIAGYSVSPRLVGGLEQADLVPPVLPGRVAWFELSMREEPSLALQTQKTIECWRAAGFEVAVSIVPGPAFWQTAEIEEVPALIAATLATLEFKQ